MIERSAPKIFEKRFSKSPSNEISSEFILKSKTRIRKKS
jgi:hypothetical protein